MPTLEQLDTPYERRRVIEYGVDGNKVVRHWHDVQHIAGPLYKSKEEKNKYGEQEMDLYLFFEGGKDGLLYQYSMRHLEQYTPEKMMEEIERVGYDTLEHFLTTFDQSVVEGNSLVLRSLSLSDSLIQSEETDMLSTGWTISPDKRRNTAVWQRNALRRRLKKRRSGKLQNRRRGQNTWAGRIR